MLRPAPGLFLLAFLYALGPVQSVPAAPVSPEYVPGEVILKFKPGVSERDRAKVLVSRHRDGEINAIAAERLGVGAIRGSGHHGSGFAPRGRL